MIKEGLRYKIGARIFGLFGLVLFPVLSVIAICYDNRGEFKTYYKDCLDMILLRDTDNW